MTAGVIAFVVSFFIPFAYWLAIDVIFERTINVRAEDHTDERIEQQGLDNNVVALPTTTEAPLKKAA